jgi:hypothetical protein
MSYTKIDNINQLRHLAKRRVECFIVLNFGLRSYKTITWHEDTQQWEVYNNIDGTNQVFTDDKDLWDSSRTHIGEAIDKGALWMDP